MKEDTAYHYDPDSEVPAEHWLSLDEFERIALVEDYHKRTKVELPNRRLHAAFHAIVETQIAKGKETEAAATLARLLSEGIDRHEAIHAIGDTLASHIYELQNGRVTGDPNKIYSKRLRELTVSSWLEKRKETS